jgi:hypothetical protein
MLFSLLRNSSNGRTLSLGGPGRSDTKAGPIIALFNAPGIPGFICVSGCIKFGTEKYFFLCGAISTLHCIIAVMHQGTVVRSAFRTFSLVPLKQTADAHHMPLTTAAEKSSFSYAK